jgi:hypothetical protein
MTKTRAYILAIVAVLSLVGVLTAARVTEAQEPESTKTRSGFHVERVSVRGACVVIVSRAGAGASDYLAAVPCSS